MSLRKKMNAPLTAILAAAALIVLGAAQGWSDSGASTTTVPPGTIVVIPPRRAARPDRRGRRDSTKNLPARFHRGIFRDPVPLTRIPEWEPSDPAPLSRVRRERPLRGLPHRTRARFNRLQGRLPGPFPVL